MKKGNNNSNVLTPNIARDLTSKADVQNFFNVINVYDWLCQLEQQDFLSKYANIEDKISYLTRKILRVEKLIKEFAINNTFTSPLHRVIQYKDDAERLKLRKTIINECVNFARINNDDDIQLGVGGMRPRLGNVKSERQIIFIIGSPASGKSTIANSFADEHGAMMLDSDLIKRKIPEFTRSFGGASLVHMESKSILDTLFREFCELGINIVYQHVGDEFEKFNQLVKMVSEKFGYAVLVVLPELDRIIATKRALKRFVNTGRYVPLSYILDDYSNNAIMTFYKMNSLEKKYSYIAIDTNVPINSQYNLIYSSDGAVKYLDTLTKYAILKYNNINNERRKNNEQEN